MGTNGIVFTIIILVLYHKSKNRSSLPGDSWEKEEFIMKKTLAIILSFLFIFGMLPMKAFAAKENFIKITEVTVNEVYSPAAGTDVQFSAKCTTKYVSVNSVNWYEKKTQSETGTALANGAKFNPGYYYTVRVELANTNNAYYFSGNGADVAATVNAKTAKVVTNNSAQVIAVEYTFPMCLTTVSKFDFTLATPVAGAAPHYPLLTGTGYESNNRGNNGAAYKNGIYWRNETDNKVLYPNENPKFEAGKKYSANITVATTTGYRVASSYTVKVNGKNVTSTKVDNECITFKVEFSVPKAHTHTSSEWKSDDEGHWKICTDTACGTIAVAKEAHKDQNKDNKCDVCKYAISKEGNDTSTPVKSTPNSSTPDSDKQVDTDDSQNSDTETEAKTEYNKKSDGKKNGALVWIILGGVVILAAAGAVVFIILKKKKVNK